MRRYWWVMKGLAFVVLAPLFVAAVSAVVMLLWNALVPSLFAGPVVNFWQAAGILILSRILFGGFRGRGGHGWRHRRAWHRMSPEERERFREGFRKWKDMDPAERHEFRMGFGGCGRRRGGGPIGPDESTQPKEG